ATGTTAAMGGAPAAGICGAKAGSPAWRRPITTNTVTEYATVAHTTRRLGSTRLMAMAGTSGTRNGATRPSGSGRDAFFRMIAWPTAMGDVGSFAISSSITDTG